MKKELRRALIIITFLSVISILLYLATSNGNVAFAADDNAEYAEDIVSTEKSVLDEFLENELVQNIFTFICSVFGSLAGLLCVFRKVKNTGLEMKATLKRCADGDESVEETVKELIEAKESFVENAVQMKEEICLLKTTIGEMKEEFAKIEEARKRDSDIIRHMLQLGFCSSSELVKNGKAAAIFEVNNGSKN